MGRMNRIEGCLRALQLEIHKNSVFELFEAEFAYLLFDDYLVYVWSK
jgi:hypothetical protein